MISRFSGFSRLNGLSGLSGFSRFILISRFSRLGVCVASRFHCKIAAFFIEHPPDWRTPALRRKPALNFMEDTGNKEAHVEWLLEEAAEARLLGWEWAEAHGVEWLAAAYNGIGPEFAGEAIRGKATSHLAVFEPAALIHDARNHVSDGTHEAFDYANSEFRYNCLQLADRAYPWWSWKRYRARFVAEALFDFVSSPAGWKAWLEAHERFVNRKEKP